MNLTGASVLLTGATGGIGHAIARRAHRGGASLVLTGRRTEVLEPLAAETGGRAVACDLADRDFLAPLVEAAGAVDVVVANAALPASGRLSDFTTEEIDRALDVNVRSVILLAQHYAREFEGRGRGHIVLISSLAGKTGTAYASLYNASKFALRGFGQGLRAELAPSGVGVSVVFPGFISDAGMFADSGATLPRGVGTSTPEDVAEAVVSSIENNRGEVDVAPLSMRLGAMFSGIAPEISAKVTRAAGADGVGRQISEGQTAKR